MSGSVTVATVESWFVLGAGTLRVVLHHEVPGTARRLGRPHDAGMPRLAPLPVDLHPLADRGRPRRWWIRLWARGRWACCGRGARGDHSAVGPAEAAPDLRALRRCRLLRAGGRGRGGPAFPTRLAARAEGVVVVADRGALAGGRRAHEVRAEPRSIELRAVRIELRNAASRCASGSGLLPVARRGPLGGRGGSRGARRLPLGRAALRSRGRRRGRRRRRARHAWHDSARVLSSHRCGRGSGRVKTRERLS